LRQSKGSDSELRKMTILSFDECMRKKLNAIMTACTVRLTAMADDCQAGKGNPQQVAWDGGETALDASMRSFEMHGTDDFE
jgi:hypothetical protein